MRVALSFCFLFFPLHVFFVSCFYTYIHTHTFYSVLLSFSDFFFSSTNTALNVFLPSFSNPATTHLFHSSPIQFFLQALVIFFFPGPLKIIFPPFEQNSVRSFAARKMSLCKCYHCNRTSWINVYTLENLWNFNCTKACVYFM